jgi:hypothetical protein
MRWPDFVIILTLLASATGLLRAASATISGVITDSGGAASEFAEVTITERSSGAARDFRTDQAGAYHATNLSAGVWELVARSPQTRSSASSTVQLHDGENVVVPLRLSGDSDTIRNGSEITRGEPGGNVEGFGPYSPRGNFAVNSVGQRSQDNNFQVDGMDNNDPWLRGPVLNPSPEAVRSIDLTAVYTPASEGHQTGAVINSVTSRGGDSWHAAAFDYLRNSALDTRNFFDGASKPGATHNNFGIDAGGPLPGKGWFLFADLDALRTRDGVTVISTVPTVAEKSGNFGGEAIYDPASITQLDVIHFIRQPFGLNVIPSSLIPVQARNLIALYPDPNLPGLANNFRYTPSAINNGERYGFRSDKALSRRDRLFVRVNDERFRNQSPGALPNNAGNDINQGADDANVHIAALGVAAAQTFVIAPDVINELRGGFTRFSWNGSAADQSSNDAASLAIPGISSGGLPLVSPEGYAQLGAAQGVPANMTSSGYELRDSLSFSRGRHRLVAGLQMVRRHLDGDATDYTSRGTFFFTPDYTDLPNTPYTGNSIASLLLGNPSEIRRDVQFLPYRLRGIEMAAFIQDSFQIGRALTVTAGLRYSYDPPVTEADNRMVNFNYSRTDPALDQFAGLGGVNTYGGLSFNKLTLAPRIGFAWALDTPGNTILRGGFSQDYDPGTFMAEGALARNPPWESRLDLFNGSLQLGPTLTAGIPAPVSASLTSAASLNAAGGAIYAIEPKSYTPYADQWGLFLDRRLSTKLTLEVSGSSSMGIHLYESYNINQPYPAPTPYAYQRYPYPPYDARVEYLGFAGGSTYYGGEAKLTGQLRPGLRLLLTYRRAKSIDDATQPETAQQSRPTGPQFIYNLRLDRSVSPFDIAQRATIAAEYDLPLRNLHRSLAETLFGDWRIDTLATLQTGFPFTPQLAINGLNNGGYQLPDRVASGALPANLRSVTQWFNTSFNASSPATAFLVPALFTYGDSGYDILRGPGLATVDASLARTYALRERLRLEIRFEVRNLFNTTNLALPNAILGVDTAGVINHTATPSRDLQIVARLNW